MISAALLSGFKDGFLLAMAFVGAGIIIWTVRRIASKVSS